MKSEILSPKPYRVFDHTARGPRPDLLCKLLDLLWEDAHFQTMPVHVAIAITASAKRKDQQRMDLLHPFFTCSCDIRTSPGASFGFRAVKRFVTVGVPNLLALLLAFYAGLAAICFVAGAHGECWTKAKPHQLQRNLVLAWSSA